MLNKPLDILSQFPVRRSKEQKQAFRDAVQTYLERMDYPVSVECGRLKSRNLVIGDPEKAKYLVTAHYDTCARLPFPNLATPFSLILSLLHQASLKIFLLLILMLLSGLMGAAALLISCSVVLPEQLRTLFLWVWCGSFLILLVLSGLMVYFGPANRSNANDNTSGVVTLLEIARTLPENQRHKVCFVLFDQEEKGLWGSKGYRKAHKEATDHQIILNLDCVGDGDYIRLIPTKKLKKDRKKLTSLYKACGYVGKKSILVQEKGFSAYASDQKSFPYSVAICALHKNKLCYYLSRIHTKKDTVLDETNINILRAALTTYICCDEVN